MCIRDSWYSTSRDARNMASPEAIGDFAARRALARLGARKIRTCKVPVLFEAPLAASLIGSFVHAVSGGSLYRKTSFLVDSLGQRVFSKKVQISERPHLRGGLASSVFDSDGVATHDREVIAVSYTHLDVYKRQGQSRCLACRHCAASCPQSSASSFVGL